MLKHSKVLFVKANGTPMQFYMRPSTEKEKLRPLIEHGGGVVTSKLTSDAYKLVEPGSRVLTCDENTVRSKYIVDCVEKNTLLNIEDYVIKMETEEVSDISDTESNNMNNKNEFILRTKAKNTRSRKEYSVEDQQAIINFICTKNRYTEIKGTRLWKDMEFRNVLPDRTWQSMKEHFLKQIYPKLKDFNLSTSQIQKFMQSKNEKGYLSRENLKLHNISKEFPEADRESLAGSVFSLGDKNCYTVEEDQKIIDYIFEDGSIAYRNVKGTVIWKDMERISLTNHTWQSMKERFLKRIVPNISKYRISPTHLRRLSTVVDITHLPKLMTETIKKQKAQTSSNEKTVISESEDKTRNITGTVDKKLVLERVGKVSSKECSTDTYPVNNKENSQAPVYSVSETALEDTAYNKNNLGKTCVKSPYFIKTGLKEVEENTEHQQNIGLESTCTNDKNSPQGENRHKNIDKKLCCEMLSNTSEATPLTDDSSTLDSFDTTLLGAAHQLKTPCENLGLRVECSTKNFRTFSQECLDAAFGSPVKVHDIFKDLNENWSTSEEEEYSKPKSQTTEDETNHLPQREKSGERKSDVSSEKSGERKSDVSSEKSGERKSDVSSEKSGERKSDVSPEKSSKRKSDVSPEKSSKRKSDVSSEKSGKRKSDVSSEKSGERKSDVSPEKSGERKSDVSSEKSGKRKSDVSSEEEVKAKSEPLSLPFSCPHTTDPSNVQTKKFRKLYCPENKNIFDKSPNVNHTNSSILKQSGVKLNSENLLLCNGSKESPKTRTELEKSRNTEEHHSPVMKDMLSSPENIVKGQLLEDENNLDKWNELLNSAGTTVSGIKEIVKEWSLLKTSIPLFNNARIIVEKLNLLRKVMNLMLNLEKYSEHDSVEEQTFLLKCLTKENTEEQILQKLTGMFPD
ncbi:uncharacterized protein LOC143229982 [Tachypleus tridentatus]|uniref:uncharacterized protein LOC143229982 n=1 Tax=Tachypleus tridentatus TaxID=6853 RepID=UPI003FD63A22